MGAAAAPIAIASTVVSGFAQIAAGQAQAKAARQQAEYARLEGKIAQLRGKQMSAARRDELNTTLASIDNIRSSRGVGLDSQTSVAIRRRQRNLTKYGLAADRVTTNLERLRADARAADYLAIAKVAPIQGFAKGFATLGSAAMKLAPSGGS